MGMSRRWESSSRPRDDATSGRSVRHSSRSANRAATATSKAEWAANWTTDSSPEPVGSTGFEPVTSTV